MPDWSNSALRISMLFGVFAVAMALFVAPFLDGASTRLAANGGAGIDFTTTASTPNRSVYTMRRSVLQRSPTSVCIIHQNGTRSGDC